MSEHSGSLTRRINALEIQIMSRRRNMRTVAAGFKRKITDWMVTPATLLEAFGIGVFMEQTSRHRDWSLATVVGAVGASIRLLLTFSSLVTGDRRRCRRCQHQAFADVLIPGAVRQRKVNAGFQP